MEIFTGVITIVIGIIVVLIQNDQRKINKARLEHERRDFQFRQTRELFDRRLAVYTAVNTIFGAALIKGKLDLADLNSMLRNTNERHFIFGKEIDDYLQEIFQKGLDLNFNHRELNIGGLTPKEKRIELNRKNLDLMNWFRAQFEIAQEKFSKYLTFPALE